MANELVFDNKHVKIMEFRGKYKFLSNFFMLDQWIEFDGLRYPSVEHAFHASKTLNVNQRKYISGLLTPGEAKRQGRKLKLRPDWELVKLDIMEELVRKKFQDPKLRTWLLETGSMELIEGNTWHDQFWGVYKGKGENHLGKILMKIREEFKRG